MKASLEHFGRSGMVRRNSFKMILVALAMAAGLQGLGFAGSTSCLSASMVHENLGGETLNSVASHDGRSMAVGTNGLVLTSTDGTTWTTLNPPTVEEIGDVVWAGDRWAMITVSGELLTWTELGGWVASFVPDSGNVFRSLEWDGTRLFVPVYLNSLEGGFIQTTSDFLSYSTNTLSPNYLDGVVTDIDYRNGVLVMSIKCFDFFQSNIQYSTDGFNVHAIFQSDSWTDANGLATNGTIAFYTTAFQYHHCPDIESNMWTHYSNEEPPFSEVLIRDADWFDNIFIGVGHDGYIGSTEDGLNWTRYPSPTHARLLRIAATADGGFVAVGEDETIVIGQFPVDLLGVLTLWPDPNTVLDLVSFQNVCL